MDSPQDRKEAEGMGNAKIMARIAQRLTEQFLLTTGDSRISFANNGFLELSVYMRNGTIHASGFLVLRTCAVGIGSADSDTLKKQRCQMEKISFFPIEITYHRPQRSLESFF